MTNDNNEALHQLRGGARRELGDWLETRDLAVTLASVRPYTMVLSEPLRELARQVRMVLAYNIPGAFVECGVWRGGASFLMADLLRQANVFDRKVWLFDSFEGIEPPEDIDGPAAMEWVNNPDGPWHLDNLCVPIEEVQKTASDLGLSSYTKFVKGWFDQTLPASRDHIGPIAILRIDCDWYSGVRCCLENLYDLVADGGFIILDDYYTFDGCAAAVHEFLGERRLAHRIESVVGKFEEHEDCQIALFRKAGSTWRSMRQIYLTTQEIVAIVAQGDTLILVDEDKWGNGELVPGRHTIPFLERDGEYWGPPEDDATAIQELERLRDSGANFIVFAWPAFWWLVHCTESSRR